MPAHDDTPSVGITIDGGAARVPAGSSAASAILSDSVRAMRRSAGGQPRAAVCGMGVCMECRVTIDGMEQRRSCQTPVCEGMSLDTRGPGAGDASAATVPSGPESAPAVLPATTRGEPWDVLIVGAGPAGIAAAVGAAEADPQRRLRIAVVDDNPGTGGQIWRGGAAGAPSRGARAWFERLAQSGVTVLPGRQVFGRSPSGALLAERGGQVEVLAWKRLVLATGARELLLPFPGWTLPGVAAAGGLQALAKSGMPVAGKRIVVAGSGPLLLAVAAALRAKGAAVSSVNEQAGWWPLLRFGGHLLLRGWGKLAQAAALKWRLLGTPYRKGVWPVAAHGAERLEAVELTDGSRRWTEPADWLACGWGLVPQTELPRLLGCAMTRGPGGAGGPEGAAVVKTDDLRRTSKPEVWCAGEPTGIGGLDAALVQGRIAGFAAAGREDLAAAWVPASRRADRFAAAMGRAFALRPELRGLAADDTIVCRCEDVPLRALKGRTDARDAKLQTRCGMGACQGRVCGPAAEFVLGFAGESVRPPVLPVPVGALATCGE